MSLGTLHLPWEPLGPEQSLSPQLSQPFPHWRCWAERSRYCRACLPTRLVPQGFGGLQGGWWSRAVPSRAQSFLFTPRAPQLLALPLHRHLGLLRRRRPGAHPAAAAGHHLPLCPLQPHQRHPGWRFHRAECVEARGGLGSALGQPRGVQEAMWDASSLLLSLSHQRS